MSNETYHVTRASSQGVYGHAISHCDPCGCNGDELYLADPQWWPHLRAGDTVELDLSDPEVK